MRERIAEGKAVQAVDAATGDVENKGAVSTARVKLGLAT
jgi:hypothetical protein